MNKTKFSHKNAARCIIATLVIVATVIFSMSLFSCNTESTESNVANEPPIENEDGGQGSGNESGSQGGSQEGESGEQGSGSEESGSGDQVSGSEGNEQGGNESEGGNQGNNEGEGGFGEDDPVVTPTPVEITAEMRVEALKNIFGITGNLTGGMSPDINLTAQTIKVIGDISSDSKIISDADIKSASEKDEETLKTLRDKYGITLSDENADVKNAIAYYVTNPSFITRNKEDYELDEYRKAHSKYYLDENDDIDLSSGNYTPVGTDEIYKKGDKKVPYYQIENNSGKTLNLTGTFYYDDLHIKATGINVDDATFTLNKKHLFSPDAILNLYNDLNGENINYQGILAEDVETKKEHKYTFPKMEFYIYDENYQNKIMDILTLMDLYVLNGKSDNIGFRNIAHDRAENIFDGKNSDNYTLFEEDKNTAKKSDVKYGGYQKVSNVSAKTIVMAAKTHVRSEFKNLIIRDKYDAESEDIDSTFTNVIFEGDVSGIKNSAYNQFNGVVYFKDKPYNIINDVTYLKGVLKLGLITNDMNCDTFKITEDTNGIYSAIDVRGVSVKEYSVNKNIIKGAVNVIYYSTDVSKDNVEQINKKFADQVDGFIRNAYSGDSKIYTFVSSMGSILASSKTPRTLAEFEYFGNNGYFETSAYEKYENDFSSLIDYDQEMQQLKEDHDTGANQIALNNKIKPRATYTI